MAQRLLRKGRDGASETKFSAADSRRQSLSYGPTLVTPAVTSSTDDALLDDGNVADAVLKILWLSA
ncbi:hypothetical protein PG987_011747 [Apiospora arundinis]